jgi:outer membrane receptor for ferrienterochelin and colicins
MVFLGLAISNKSTPRRASARILLLLVPVLVLTPTTRDWAQTSGEAQRPARELIKMNLEDLVKMNVESVYSASKYVQKVTDAPSSVTIVTSDEIRKYGYRTLADILRSVRGFYVTYDRNYAYVGTSGLLRPGDYNSRILLLVDGHRMNEPIYDSMYIDRSFCIDVDLIERVEVIRGPSSSIYGTNAFFAVVNVITKQPNAVKDLQSSGGLSSFGTQQSRLSYSHTFKNSLKLLVSSSLYGSQGQRRLYFKEFDTPATNNGIAQNADYEQSEQLFTKLSYKDFTVLGTYGSRLKGIPTGSFGTVFNDQRNRTIDNRGFLDVSYEHRYGGGFDLTARVYYDHYDYYGHYIYNYSQTDAPLLVVNNDLLHTKWWGGELKVTKEVSRKHKLTAGSEFRDDFQAYQGNYDISPFTLYLDNRNPDKVAAAYVEDEFTIRPNLILNAGARYDHYDTFGGTVNPRLALIYSPREKTTLKLLYGTAFRAPSDYELYYYSPLFRSNPHLNPETIKTTEVAVEQYAGNHFRLSASGYHYRIRDLISAQTDPSDGLVQFRNADRVRTNGVEMELEGKWPHGVEARVNYALQRAENADTGASLTNSPEHLANLNVAGPLIPGRFSAGLDLHYVSARRTLGGNSLNGFIVPNLTLFSQRLMKGFDVTASLYNLFDTRYGYPGSVEHPEDALYQDGRTFRLKLTYTFGAWRGDGK